VALLVEPLLIVRRVLREQVGMITAKRRASATIAFFIPRCLAIFIAQALSQDSKKPPPKGRGRSNERLRPALLPFRLRLQRR
jgi:hypothetical protein